MSSVGAAFIFKRVVVTMLDITCQFEFRQRLYLKYNFGDDQSKWRFQYPTATDAKA